MRAAKSEWLRHRAECERAYAVEFIFTIVLPLSDRCKCEALYLTPAVDVRMWPFCDRRASTLSSLPIRIISARFAAKQERNREFGIDVGELAAVRSRARRRRCRSSR